MGISKKEERLGYQGRTRMGELFTIVEYNYTYDITIEFENGDRKHTTWRNIAEGKIIHHSSERKKIDRTGEEIVNCYGEHCRITKYLRVDKIEVTFDDGSTTWGDYRSFKKGRVHSPFTPTILGKGFIGEGAYSRKTHLKEYETWVHMLERCYSPLLKKRAPGYEGVTCCDRWLNFQLFCEDIHSYGQDLYDKSAKYELDKDLLVSGNKVYCPERCCLLPTELNGILTQATRGRGELPIGVWRDSERGGYRAQVSKRDRIHKSGQRFKTPEEAFDWYKREKEAYVRERADAWSEKLAPNVVDALYKWKVHITD